MRTSPPLASMRSTIGLHNRSGGAPSKKAILDPSVSFKKRLRAVRTTVAERSSGFTNARALLIAMNTSSTTRLGAPSISIYSEKEYLSISSTYFWPFPLTSSQITGSRAYANWIFSAQERSCVLRRIATIPFRGAGTLLGKSKRENWPGFSGRAKIIVCSFHCSRSWMPSSVNSCSMFGYAPKKMWSPVSYQSPSSSCHAATLPPRTSLASTTTGLNPNSERYLAVDNPANPAPITAIVPLSPGFATGVSAENIEDPTLVTGVPLCCSVPLL
mmetsp:Transcript_28222/g.39258  ORF Transcript_28222/g.39258 Transcript_28222/m.39258 type:complete len:272 (+) Transcript_28222:891-1706(+)